MGEDKLNALIQESLAVAAKTEALKPSELAAVVVDTTVQPKNVAHPTVLSLQLCFDPNSESIGRHDSEVMDGGGIDRDHA